MINILTGKKSPLQEKMAKGGQIALNLSPALNNLIDDANAHGVTLFNPIKAATNQGLSFTVVSKKQVSKFSGLFNLIVKAKWIIPIVALGLAILAMVLAVERRKTLLRLAVGVALMTLVLLVGYFARPRHLHRTGRERRLQTAGCRRRLRHGAALLQGRPALDPADVGPGRLRGLAGRAGPLRRVDPQDHRRRRPLGGRAGPRALLWCRRAASESSRVRRSAGWILEHVNGLRIVGVVVAGLILVFGGNLTGWSLLVIVIVLAVYLGLLQLVAAWARKASEAGPGPGGGSSHRPRARRDLGHGLVSPHLQEWDFGPWPQPFRARTCTDGGDRSDSGNGGNVRGGLRGLVHDVAPADGDRLRAGPGRHGSFGARRAPRRRAPRQHPLGGSGLPGPAGATILRGFTASDPPRPVSYGAFNPRPYPG